MQGQKRSRESSVHKSNRYADAVKQVQNKIDLRNAGPVEERTERLRKHAKHAKINDNLLVINKTSFLASMAEVINCSEQTVSRTEKIKIILRAAGKYLNAEEITFEQINEKLRAQTINSQTACGGSYWW